MAAVMTISPGKRWLFITSCWAALYVFFALGEAADQVGKLHPLGIVEVFEREFVTDVLWIPLTYFVLWFSRAVPIRAARRLSAFVTHLAISVAIAAVHIAAVGVRPRIRRIFAAPRLDRVLISQRELHLTDRLEYRRGG
jgi:hypothetical protein